MNKLKKDLLRLVRMDYGFHLYNYSEYGIRFSFYHLNSCYNAFAIAYPDRESHVAWQYANMSTKAGCIALRIANELMKLYGTPAFDKAMEEVEFYSKLSEAVFEAKYSLEVERHTN